jgi:hypothetical protein
MVGHGLGGGGHEVQGWPGAADGVVVRSGQGSGWAALVAEWGKCRGDGGPSIVAE